MIGFLETWKWRKYLPFWRDEGMEVAPYMKEIGLDPREYNELFREKGLELYEIVKRLSMDRMLDEDFADLSDNQKAMIGANVFLDFMKQLEVEIRKLSTQETE